MISYHIQCFTRVHSTMRPYWAERDDHADSKRATINDIATGQIENVLRVFEADHDGGSFREVTEDMALDVIHCLDDVPRGQHLRDFLETNAPEAYREFCIEHEMEVV
jgi:hypothetical protein